MNPYHLAYNLISLGVGGALMPALWLGSRKSATTRDRFDQRFGYYPRSVQEGFQGRPRIWFHAVSVGEVGVAAAVINAMRKILPQCDIAISTTTVQGLVRAKALFENDITCFYAPLDLIGPTRRVLDMVRPDLLVLLETEIWPNLIVSARQRGARIAILNGRISVRTIKGYRRIQPLMRHVLSHIDAFSMISAADALRIQSLGADAHRIVVNGNAKFDAPDPHAGSAEGAQNMKWALDLYGLQADMPVFVAGSTRQPEERIILDVFAQIRQAYPQTVLIVAPRHIERVEQVEQWVRQKGLTSQRRSDLDGTHRRRHAPVIILDTIGELSATYSVASFVFCGGSLIPKGGQNVLEPALWEKPVLYGRSMEDFADARTLIEKAGGGFTVDNEIQMAALITDWLKHPHKARMAGRAARQAICAHRGAAHKHAVVIAQLL
jgi:3-deoxy-D-manno-octulosonic-acid transferase